MTEILSSEFGTGSMDEVLKQMEGDLKGKQMASPFWTPPANQEGNFTIRILPLLKSFNEQVFYSKQRVHWLNRRPYQCLAQSITDKNGVFHEAEECPICRKVKQLYDIAGDSKDSEEFKLAGQIRARDQFVSRAVVRGLKDEKGNDIETRPVFYNFGKTIFEMLLNFIKSGDFGNFLSVAEGRDFVINKSGTGRNTKYSGSYIKGTATPVFTEKEKLKELLENLKTMDYKQLVEFTPEAEMKRALNELLNGEQEEEKPKKVEKEVAKENPKSEVKEEASDFSDDLDSILSAF